ncbi:hypothetical protein Shyhy01_59740 [Streptomyces hygroscopicus subsp. hygroscopicus]|nr:hypothetical protein Shyhy01_59740 [Streptomyces hygroscopicus subsp. hygroscopicus]
MTGTEDHGTGRRKRGAPRAACGREQGDDDRGRVPELHGRTESEAEGRTGGELRPRYGRGRAGPPSRSREQGRRTRPWAGQEPRA